MKNMKLNKKETKQNVKKENNSQSSDLSSVNIHREIRDAVEQGICD